jgi:hypothetical protein
MIGVLGGTRPHPSVEEILSDRLAARCESLQRHDCTLKARHK